LDCVHRQYPEEDKAQGLDLSQQEEEEYDWGGVGVEAGRELLGHSDAATA
jgi:hypothetical protein